MQKCRTSSSRAMGQQCGNVVTNQQRGKVVKGQRRGNVVMNQQQSSVSGVDVVPFTLPLYHSTTLPRRSLLTFLWVAGVFALSTFGSQLSPSFAKDISVTQVKVTGNEAEVQINNVLTVSEIKVSREGALSLKFPETVSKSGRVYPQITLTTQQADEAIRKAISTEKIEGPVMEWDLKKDLKVKDLRRHPRKNTQYFAMISFADALDVSCQFVRQGDTVKIRWPARPPENQGGKWKNQVYFKKKEIRSEAESVLIPQFLAKEKELFPAGSSDKSKKPAKKMTVGDDE